MNIATSTLFFLPCLLVLSWQDALSQQTPAPTQPGQPTQSTQPAQPPKVLRRAPPPPRVTDEFKANVLKNQPDLPNLPSFHGKNTKVISAIQYSNIQGGPAYNIRLITDEDEVQVIQWYESNLSGAGWKTTTNGRTITGVARNGDSCWVKIIPGNKVGSKTTININYRMILK